MFDVFLSLTNDKCPLFQNLMFLSELLSDARNGKEVLEQKMVQLEDEVGKLSAALQDSQSESEGHLQKLEEARSCHSEDESALKTLKVKVSLLEDDLSSLREEKRKTMMVSDDVKMPDLVRDDAAVLNHLPNSIGSTKESDNRGIERQV